MLLETVKTIKSILRLNKHKVQISEKTLLLFHQSVRDRIDVLVKEKTTYPPSNIRDLLRRGNIVWCDFGFNIGNEFGGRHPALILKYINNGEDAYVIPLNSVKRDTSFITKNGKPKNWLVKIPAYDNGVLTVFNMRDEMDRFCNVYNLVRISWLRFDFTDKIGFMRSDYIKKVDKAIYFNRYKPQMEFSKDSENVLTKV